AFAGGRPGVAVVDPAGSVLADVDLAGLVPVALTAAGDIDGDGSGELAVLGYLPDGGVELRIVSVGLGVIGEARVVSGFSVEAITLLPATSTSAPSVAVLLRHNGGKRGAVAVHDVATGERLALFRTAPIAAGAVTTADAGGGPIVVIAFRNARTGRVRVEGRALLSGERLWTGAGSLGFDPADADQIQAGSVLITGHRFGDGNVEVAWWDPGTGRRVG
ncbi:MAG TPA: hypothetical protein VMX37_01890, partial [Acidimicrobiia bacterium]|nr:hypothetical protein [Acidimicrobiia bacterium]